MSNKLTDKQEAFVQALLILGTSQREAYKIGYPNTKMKDKTIDECASRMFKKHKVNARYNELHDKIVAMAEKKAIFTVEGVLNDLKELIERNKNEDDKLALDGLKTAMKHLGMLTDKVEHSGTINISEKTKLIDKYLEGDKD